MFARGGVIWTMLVAFIAERFGLRFYEAGVGT